MTLDDLIRGGRPPQVATATLATFATEDAPATDQSVATVATVAVAKPTDAEVRELRRLLTDLLHDAPDEVEAEVARTLADDAMAEALACYRRIRDEYHAAGELPGQRTLGG